LHRDWGAAQRGAKRLAAEGGGFLDIWVIGDVGLWDRFLVFGGWAGVIGRGLGMGKRNERTQSQVAEVGEQLAPWSDKGIASLQKSHDHRRDDERGTGASARSITRLIP
jgi:hypothetical protein